jgi:hypothetical protein
MSNISNFLGGFSPIVDSDGNNAFTRNVMILF